MTIVHCICEPFSHPVHFASCGVLKAFPCWTGFTSFGTCVFCLLRDNELLGVFLLSHYAGDYHEGEIQLQPIDGDTRMKCAEAKQREKIHTAQYSDLRLAAEVLHGSYCNSRNSETGARRRARANPSPLVQEQEQGRTSRARIGARSRPILSSCDGGSKMPRKHKSEEEGTGDRACILCGASSTVVGVNGR